MGPGRNPRVRGGGGQYGMEMLVQHLDIDAADIHREDAIVEVPVATLPEVLETDLYSSVIRPLVAHRVLDPVRVEPRAVAESGGVIDWAI